MSKSSKISENESLNVDTIDGGKSSGFISSKTTTFISGSVDGSTTTATSVSGVSGGDVSGVSGTTTTGGTTGGGTTMRRRSSNTSSSHAGTHTPPSPQSSKSSPQSHPRYISKNVFMAAAAGTLDVSAHDFDDLCLGGGSLDLKESTITLTPQSSPPQFQQSVNPSSLFAHPISRSASSSSVSSTAAMASNGTSISITSTSSPINSNSAMSADTLVAEEINKNKWRNR